jgi:basic membrane protein A
LRETLVRQRRWFAILAFIALFGLLGSACSTDDDGGGDEAATCEGETGDEATAEPLGGDDDPDGADMKVGLVFDVGGRGDESFNDSAFAGLEAAGENMGVEVKALEPNADGSNREDLMRSLAEDDFDMIVGVGFAFAENMTAVSTDFPDITFAIVDGVVETDNVTSLLFAEEQGSYLVGAAAALKSGTGKIGFVGGVENDLIKKFQAGFEAGAKEARDDVEIESKYIAPDGDFSGFDDQAKGKTVAAGLYENGADVVYHASGKSGLGVFRAAVEADRLAIGVDSNQYLSADEEQQKCILTSMLKRVDIAVYDAIKSFVGGDLEAGVQTYDLENGGIDYATQGGQLEETDKIEEFKQQIVDGDIEVPTEP